VTARLACDLVIPALNERPSLDALFEALAPHRPMLRHVLLADNGSTDGTRRLHGRSKVSGTIDGVTRAGAKIIWTILVLRPRRGGRG
jgi:hypothetical protein